MELLPDELRQKLPGHCAQDATDDPIVYARYFIRGTIWDWYVAEGQQVGDDFEFYGYIRGDRESWDTFLLSDLEISRGPDGSSVERDLKFKPGNFTEIVPAPDV